jgi:hypothetical protein
VILWRERREEERISRIAALEGVGIKRVAEPGLLWSNAADSLPRYLRYGSRRLGFRPKREQYVGE